MKGGTGKFMNERGLYMKKTTAVLLSVVLSVIFFGAILSTGCKKTQTPTSASPSLNEATPTPMPIAGGGINVSVVDNGKTPSGMSLDFIPPDNSVTMHRSTLADGTCLFQPDTGELEQGTWTVVAAATPFPPYAPSVASLAVTANNETLKYETQAPSFQVTPPAVTQFTGTSGGTFTYQLTYTQPGNLLVPVWLYMPTPASNWSVSSSAATIGTTSPVSVTITLTGSQCVDQESVPATIYGFDAISNTTTPNAARAISDFAPVTKNFTSNLTVNWQATDLNNGFYSCASGVQLYLTGNLTITDTNGCHANDVMTIQWNGGNCSSDYLQTPNGNINNNQTGGGSISFTPGTYSITFYTGWYPSLVCNFHGQQTTTGLSTNGSNQCMSVNF
jgi:hypothetical protein